MPGPVHPAHRAQPNTPARNIDDGAETPRNKPANRNPQTPPFHRDGSPPTPDRAREKPPQRRPNRRLNPQKAHPRASSRLELDALYALKVARGLVPGYRKDAIERALDRYDAVVRTYWERHREDLLRLHRHVVLAAVGTFGLLQQHRPDTYRDTAAWTDIFTDRGFYQTQEVERLAEAGAV